MDVETYKRAKKYTNEQIKKAGGWTDETIQESVDTAISKNTQVAGLTTEIEKQSMEIEGIKKTIIPQFATNVYMGTATDYDSAKKAIDTFAIRCLKCGIKRMTLNPKISYADGVFSIPYSLTEVFDYARETYPTLKIDAVKFSTRDIKELFTSDSIRTAYVSFVTDLAKSLKAYQLEYITIANESYQMYSNEENEQMMLSCIEAVQSQDIKCGITTGGMIDVAGALESVLNAVDIIAINVYPLISFKGNKTTYDDCLKGWKSTGLKEWVQMINNDYGKKAMFSESGVRDYFELFTADCDLDRELPSDAVASNGKCLAMWIYGLMEYIKDFEDKLYRVQLWYLDNISESADYTELANVIRRYKEVE